MKIKIYSTLALLLFINSCSYPELTRNEIVYSNNFEDESLNEIDGGVINNFNNSKVIGFYNKDGFNLNLTDIGSHDYITVSFDLYIHGTWDGNANGFEQNDKPDKWIMELRPEMNLYQNVDVVKYETTFSNSPCYSNWCKRQSYPQAFPYESNPYSGAIKIDLPRTCDGYWGETSLYKIEKTFEHKGNALILRFYDELYQPNAIDYLGNSSELCDESWSLDNIKIRAISYE